MVRRSAVDRSPQPTEYADYAAGTGDLAPGGGKKSRTAPGWRGAGGRWLVWVFRIVVWAVLLLIGYRGVTAIMAGETSNNPAPAPAASPSNGFPAALASAYALQFGQVYLNADPATASQRASQLATFLPAGTDPQLGWNGSGSLQLQSEQVANIAVSDAHHALVTLLARVNGQLMELGVPIYYSGGALAVTGEPAWLPAPAKASVPTPSAPTSDAATQSELMSQLPAFFQAYASGDQVTIDRFLAPGAHVTGLDGALTFGSLTSVTVPTGGDTRHTVATVLWHVPGQASPAPTASNASSPAGLEMSYALTIVKRSGTWYISAIGPSLQPAGSS